MEAHADNYLPVMTQIPQTALEISLHFELKLFLFFLSSSPLSRALLYYDLSPPHALSLFHTPFLSLSLSLLMVQC